MNIKTKTHLVADLPLGHGGDAGVLARLVHVGPLLVNGGPACRWVYLASVYDAGVYISPRVSKYTPLNDWCVLVHLPIDCAPPYGGLVHVLVVGQPHLAVDSNNSTCLA